MAFVQSGSSIQGTAYLTGIGRKYLFNQNNIRFDEIGDDLFQIVSFALGDPDINYNVGTQLIAGQVPDVSGESEGCLKSAVDYVQSSMLLYSNIDSLATSAVTYNGSGTFVANNVLSINVNFGGGSQLPTGTDTGGGNGGGGNNTGGGTFPNAPNGLPNSPNSGNNGAIGGGNTSQQTAVR